MTKKTKTLLIILVSVLLITGIGVVVLATTDLGKGTIFQKEAAPETTDEVENSEEETSTVKYDMSTNDYLIELIKNNKTISLEESGEDEDTYAYYNNVVAYVDENGKFYNKYGFGITFSDRVIPFYMVPEDLETQEAREATFQRLLSLIPEGFDLDNETPEQAVLRAMDINYSAYNVEKIVEGCPYGYYIFNPYNLNEDLTVSEPEYRKIYDSVHDDEHPGVSPVVTGHVMSKPRIYYDNGDYEDYYDYSQASGWTLEVFNEACNKIEQDEYASTWEIIRTDTYFKATDKWGCYCELDYLGGYQRTYYAYYVDDDAIEAFYKDPNQLTPEEYVKLIGRPISYID